MKKYILLLFTIILFCSCEEDLISYCGTEETAEKIASFMTTNMKSANKMSDEEMEDVIRELHVSAVKIYCVRKKKKDMLPNERIFSIGY